MPDKLSQILWKEKKKRALSTDGPITGHQSKKKLKKKHSMQIHGTLFIKWVQLAEELDKGP